MQQLHLVIKSLQCKLFKLKKKHTNRGHESANHVWSNAYDVGSCKMPRLNGHHVAGLYKMKCKISSHEI